MNDAPQNSDFVLPGPPGRSGGGAMPSRSSGPAERRSAAARWAWGFAVLVLVVSVFSLGLSWRTQQRVRGLEQELVKRQDDSAGQATEARVLSKSADDSARDSAAKVAMLEARIAEVSLQRGQLDDVIQQLNRSRDENVVADVDAAVRVGMQQMLITGNPEPLVSALRQSDDKLARSNQPRLEPLRRAIARDLDKSRAVGTVNISTLSIKLDEAVRLIDELPLLSSADSRGVPLPDLGDAPAPSPASTIHRGSSALAEPTWLRSWTESWSLFWGHVWSEARGLIRVTRIDHPEAMLVAPDNAFYLRENIKLRLLNARLAVLSRQFDTAQGDLVSVQTTLERYFDRSSRKVGIAIDTVRQVTTQARQVVLPRPDDTLSALAALSSATAR